MTTTGTTTVGGFAEIRARRALHESGIVAAGPLIRASSTRNEVFLTRDHVIRFNTGGSARLLREAKLSEYLPNWPFMPRVVAHGGRPGDDYLIHRRLDGSSLSRWWPDMGRDQRREAVRQLSHCVRAIHELPTPVAAPLPELTTTPHLLDHRGGPVLAPLLAGLDGLGERTDIDPGIVSEARRLAAAGAPAVADHDRTMLVHGDLTFENVLWNGREITGLIDFEWCRGGPADLDLDVLARYLDIPQAHVDADLEARTRAEDHTEVVGWLVADYPEWFAGPDLATRLFVYALAFEVRAVLEAPPLRDTAGPTLHPVKRLTDLVTTGGQVKRVIDRLGALVS